MTPREIEVMETIGARVRTGVKPVIVADETPKWSRVILPVLFLVCVVTLVLLNSTKHDVSADVPAPVYLDGGR